MPIRIAGGEPFNTVCDYIGSRSGHMLNLKQGKHLDTQKRRLQLLKHASEVLNSNQYSIKMGCSLNLGCLTPIRGFLFFLAHS